VLRVKRTLDGAEIDKIISDRQARQALAAEHRRRADWRKRELSAHSFDAKCNHDDDAPWPYPAQDRGQWLRGLGSLGLADVPDRDDPKSPPRAEGLFLPAAVFGRWPCTL